MLVAAPHGTNPFQNWLDQLENRHLADLTFTEVSRALRSLSATYVERRTRLAQGAALSGAGKRAAFALFYGPLHFLLVERIAEKLCPVQESPALLVDLGCGTGAAGAAWAARWSESRAGRSPIQVVGIDRSPWALEEAARTYRHFGLTARLLRGDATALAWPDERATLLAAFTMNELPGAARETLLARLLDRAGTGNRVLVVEPLARGIAPWWEKERRVFESAGGRADEWRFPVDLPPLVAKLDRASGLDHRELTARTLFAEG